MREGKQAMQLSTLTELPLDLTRDDIMHAMAPFVKRRVGGEDAEWRRMARKRKKDIVEVSTPGGGKSYQVVKVEYK